MTLYILTGCFNDFMESTKHYLYISGRNINITKLAKGTVKSDENTYLLLDTKVSNIDTDLIKTIGFNLENRAGSFWLDDHEENIIGLASDVKTLEFEDAHSIKLYLSLLE